MRHNPENNLNLSANASGCRIWARAQILNGPIRVEDETTLREGVVVGPDYKSQRKGEEANFMANFSFFTSFSIGKAYVFEVKFIGRTVGFITIRDFLWGESDLWSDVWPAMDGMVSMLTDVSHDEAKIKDLP